MLNAQGLKKIALLKYKINGKINLYFSFIKYGLSDLLKFRYKTMFLYRLKCSRIPKLKIEGLERQIAEH